MTIEFPYKRLYGFIGAERSGKDKIADFLTETRSFEQYAFADQIKEEFGIAKEDFEASKIAGNITDLRKRLWDFSAKKKEKDPLYFIRKVIDKAQKSIKSIVITDIRTGEELSEFIKMDDKSCICTVYWIRTHKDDEIDKYGYIKGSKLKALEVYNTKDIKSIINREHDGLYNLYKKMDKFFFIEDIIDLFRLNHKTTDIKEYIQQFNIQAKQERH